MGLTINDPLIMLFGAWRLPFFRLGVSPITISATCLFSVALLLRELQLLLQIRLLGLGNVLGILGLGALGD